MALRKDTKPGSPITILIYKAWATIVYVEFKIDVKTSKRWKQNSLIFYAVYCLVTIKYMSHYNKIYIKYSFFIAYLQKLNSNSEEINVKASALSKILLKILLS